MLTVGLDVHYKSWSLCVLNADGGVVFERKGRGGRESLYAELSRLEEPFQICFEASCGYGPLHDRLSKMARRVAMAHPGQVRLIFRSKRKTDRIDARKLATLLLLDQVPEAYAPKEDVRAWRGLIEHRRRLIDKRTRAKNGLRAMLRGADIAPLKAGEWLWSKAGRQWLARVDWTTPLVALRRDTLLEEVEHYDKQIKRVTDALDAMADRQPGVALLQTIPGVGPRTAEAVVAYIDKPGRFSRSRCAGAYFGLTPQQDQSASRNHMGHITRNGPATVRQLLTEASWQGIRYSPTLKARFERIARDDRDRRKIALVATANHLARVMLAMLQTGEAWRESPRRCAA